jgi:NADPH-dependent glutamate synthase beta subunit-like oxidoreductase
LKLAPCRRACPLGVNCQGYVQLIARGEEAEAMKQLRETLPFPGILGRICSQPCEADCHRQKIEGQAVSIRMLKRYLYDLEEGKEAPLPETAPASGRKVAIVGAGPAGIMAAHDLRVRGHGVTVFDAESEPGGMLRWAIPEFRLPRSVVEKETRGLEQMRISFQCGVRLGKGISLDKLKSEFDAVVLAVGCSKHGGLNIPGEDSPGVLHGLPFLHAVRDGHPPEIGKKVVVIGGGNVAVDAAQTALRIGAEKVSLVALETEADLPAYPWAIKGASAEGVGLECSWGNPTFIVEKGVLAGLDFQRCVQVFDADGNFLPTFDDCELRHLDADTVIVAVGQALDTTPFQGTSLADENRVLADDLTLQTADEKIFSAGDAASGPSSVVEAMASGRRAAESVDRYLAGEHLRYGRSYFGPYETDFEIDTERGSKDPRASVREHRCTGRNDFSEIERGVDKETARREARRCYSCGEPFGKYRTCWFCLPCEVDCPHEALWVEIPYLLR